MAITRRRSSRRPSEQFLRYILRRKPCLMIIYLEWLIAVSLIVTAVLLAHAYLAEMKELETIHYWMMKRDKLLKFSSPLWHCQYDLPPSRVEDYDLRMCEISTSEMQPVAYALQRTHSANCVDRVYSVKCHADKPNGVIRFFQSQPKSCAGLSGTGMPNELITLKAKTLVARVSAKGLVPLMNKNVSSADLIIRCPRCRVKSHYYKVDDKNVRICARQLETVEEGWPSVAQYCDDEERREFDIQRGVYCGDFK